MDGISTQLQKAQDLLTALEGQRNTLSNQLTHAQAELMAMHRKMAETEAAAAKAAELAQSNIDALRHKVEEMQAAVTEAAVVEAASRKCNGISPDLSREMDLPHTGYVNGRRDEA